LTEVETLTRALLDGGVKSILYSYFFIESMRREAFVDKMQREYPHVRWFLDSGAFSYMAQWSSGRSSLPDPYKYFERYCQYIETYGSRFCRIAELDLDHGVKALSPREVTEWREEMVRRWPHLPVMPVWHPSRGTAGWKEYLADPRFKFVGLGGGTAQQSVGYQRQMVMAAHRAGKRVHGFAMTKVQTVLKEVPYDTVDSTSWVMGQKFGTLYVFRHNRFFQLGKDQGKDKRMLFRAYFRAIGVDPELIDDSDKNLKRIARLRKNQVAAVQKEYARRRRHPLFLTPEEAAKKLAIAEVRKANVCAWRMLADRLETIQKRRERRHAALASGQERQVDLEHPPTERVGVMEVLFGRPPREREDREEARFTPRMYEDRPTTRLRERPDLPRPAALRCPDCGERHIDQDEWEKRPHHTHRCLFCGKQWTLEEYLYGVPEGHAPEDRDGPAGNLVAELPDRTGPRVKVAKLRERLGIVKEPTVAERDGEPGGLTAVLPAREGKRVKVTDVRGRTGREQQYVDPALDRVTEPQTKGSERDE
jgi:hypothetical protein